MTRSLSPVRTGRVLVALLAVLSLLAVTFVAPPAMAEPGADRTDYIEGRFRDTSDFGDFSSPLTQALAVLALARAGEPTDNAVPLLLRQQCSDGGFSAAFLAPSADGSDPACNPSVDTTGFVVQALHAAGLGDDPATAAATSWLEGIQADDGSFASPDGKNVNSSGLAIVALDLGGATQAADDARAWILTQQDGCEAETPGAIPFNVENRVDDVRSSTQALPGLTSSPLGALTATGADPGTPGTGCPGDLQPIPAAAAYLVGELGEDPPAMESFPGFPDVGLTIDTLWALAATGTAGSVITDIALWLPGQVAGYTQGVPFDRDGATYAGATAKLALGLQVAGLDPRDAAGTDLIEQLLGTQVDAPDDVTVSCDAAAAEVAPGTEIGCELAGLISRETVAVTVTANPVLLDEAVSADGSGEAVFAFRVPEDLDDGSSITIQVDGLGAPGLATLDLRVRADAGPEPATGGGSTEPVAPQVDDDFATVEPPAQEDVTRPTQVDAGLSPSLPVGSLLVALLGAILVLGGLTAGLRARREAR